MSALTLEVRELRDRMGLKGPGAADWLAGNGIATPSAPNTWTDAEKPDIAAALLVARLGASEFFLEDGATGTALKQISQCLDEPPPGVYPVIREDWAFLLGGEGVHEVLAQVCNVNFAALPLDSHPLIMTLMIGVAVLVVPQNEPGGQRGTAGRGDAVGRGDAAARQYRIWCDPTFGPYMSESLGAVVIECGGSYRGVSG
jgi:sarcosine oxidase subunit gamma